MNSKAWQVFGGKIRVLKQHLQLMDVALNIANKQVKEKKGSDVKIAQALGVKIEQYMQLNIPAEDVDIKRTFVTSRNKLHEQAIVDLSRIFSDYVANIIAEVEHKKPMQFFELLTVNSDRTIKYEDIIRIGNYNQLINEMAHRIFRSLENKRNTKEMLEKIINKADINIDKDIKDNALLFLEIRHLIIHNNTTADEKFLNMPNNDVVKVNRNNMKICLNFETTNNAITQVFRLCKLIDDELLRVGLL